MLLEDCIRFAGTEKLSPGLEGGGGAGEHGEIAWVEPTAELESTYPGLHELVVNLHALPFELNSKAPGLRLARPCRGKSP